MLTDEQSRTLAHLIIVDAPMGEIDGYVNTLLAAERERVIEECAKVCEETYPESIGNNIVQLPQFPNDGLHCAAAIRALKGK